MLLFPSDMEFLVNMNATLGLRTELVGGPVQFFRQTSDGLMSVFNFFSHVVNIKVPYFSGRSSKLYFPTALVHLL